ncbi:MAG: hypothetical protein ACOY3P_14130 [Planctomycetota bacterium]
MCRFPVVIAVVCSWLWITGLWDAPQPIRAAEPDGGRYLEAARRFADAVLEHGRDTYGTEKTPLFVDGLHAESFEPVRWQRQGETWVLSNFASQQPLIRLLDGLTAIEGDAKYRQAAEDAARYALAHLRAPNGLLYWGGHLALDLDAGKPVGQGGTTTHELKGHQPYYELMWRVDPQATERLLEAIWGGHVLDWALLDYNRHASTTKSAKAQWDHAFNATIEVPFPAQGSNLSFANVTPPLVHCGTVLALHGNDDALLWTRRLLNRWQRAKDGHTGLCGGQLSYRKEDRAQEVLGHVHPQINEAKIVATYHQTCRYHEIPLVSMQAAERLLAGSGDPAEAAREFIRWATEDLEIYARECYDPTSGRFIAKMTDGTPIEWRESKTSYYVPESFAPVKPDGPLFWGYATAYRLARTPPHWRMVCAIAKAMDLGDLGEPDGARKLRLDTPNGDWQVIYPLLELHRATGDAALLQLACRVGDNIVKQQSPSGLFPRKGRAWARTGDDAPLALLHLAAAIRGERDTLPQAVYDNRFFHCVYDGPLEPHQQKRADARTYDHLVFYGED